MSALQQATRRDGKERTPYHGSVVRERLQLRAARGGGITTRLGAGHHFSVLWRYVHGIAGDDKLKDIADLQSQTKKSNEANGPRVSKTEIIKRCFIRNGVK